MLDGPVLSLYDGQRIKLFFARTMLLYRSNLSLEASTFYFSCVIVNLIQYYLNSFQDVSIIIVSEEEWFWNNVCTNITQLESLKLKFHKGNINEVVKKFSQAKFLFEMKQTKL